MAEPDEIAAAFDPAGRLALLPRRGGSSDVSFALAEMPLLSGVVVTHNHPFGGPLSGEDAAFAFDHDPIEVRAVLPEGIVYSMCKPSHGWPDGETMMRAAERCMEVLLAAESSRKRSGLHRMTKKESESLMFADQGNAFHEIGVVLVRGNVWQ